MCVYIFLLYFIRCCSPLVLCACFVPLALICWAQQKKQEEQRRFEVVRPQAAAAAKPPMPRNIHEMYCPKVSD